MSDIENLFSLLGGPAEVGRALGISTEHATTIRRRKSIPIRYWGALIRLAVHRRLPLDEVALAKLHTNQNSSPRKKKAGLDTTRHQAAEAAGQGTP